MIMQAKGGFSFNIIRQKIKCYSHSLKKIKISPFNLHTVLHIEQ